MPVNVYLQALFLVNFSLECISKLTSNISKDYKIKYATEEKHEKDKRQ